ncbi:MAG: hypothetical protein LWX83_06160 [Anaerolineae bacterium]|nr:hypothetical protein [Anaerolineae bacterium]
MQPGLLWFDDDPELDLITKINRAIVVYQNQYGLKPDLCFVHPSMLPRKKQVAVEIEIRTDRQLKPDLLWLGNHAL